MRKVLVLGASGMVAPNVMPGLESHYDLRLTDVEPHPSELPITEVDITRYEQVFLAAQGMDAIMNFSVIRDDPALSFHVNTKGAYHVMKAAAEHGIRKVIHTGPQLVRHGYAHDFDIQDPPLMPGTGYYGLTKLLSMEICRIYAREYGIQTICFLFNGLRAKPAEHVHGHDFPPFTIVWEDLQHACRLALEVESVPEGYQVFNMLSYLSHGKFGIDKARRLLGYEPLGRPEDFFRRIVGAKHS